MMNLKVEPEKKEYMKSPYFGTCKFQKTNLVNTERANNPLL